jgi:hypothetical protein
VNDWTTRAACLGKPTNWFHPEHGSRPELPPISRRALALCASCPVSDECLAHTLVEESIEFSLPHMGRAPEEIHHWIEGIRGGTLTEDRKRTRGMPAEQRMEKLKAISSARAKRLGLVKGDAA